jgi:hypothetical protein
MRSTLSEVLHMTIQQVNGSCFLEDMVVVQYLLKHIQLLKCLFVSSEGHISLSSALIRAFSSLYDLGHEAKSTYQLHRQCAITPPLAQV